MINPKMSLAGYKIGAEVGKGKKTKNKIEVYHENVSSPKNRPKNLIYNPFAPIYLDGTSNLSSSIYVVTS